MRRALQEHRDKLGRAPDSSPSHDLEFFVHPNETEGLPALPGDSAPGKSSRITSFRRKVSQNNPFKNKGSGDSTSRAEDLNKEEEGPDQEGKEGIFPDTLLGPGSGILSALLAAYDRQQSRFSSIASTPHSTDIDLPIRSHPHEGSSQIHAQTQSLSLKKRKREISLESILNKINRDDNLPATRSSAGVFGPLLAATGNLSSIAAPIHSSVAPDGKRPGYRLSRYSHAESELASQPPSVSGSAPLSPVETRQGNGQAETPTREQDEGPITIKRRGWPSTFRGLSSGLSSRHRSPETTDTEESTRPKRHKRRKTKRRREEIYVCYISRVQVCQ